jgi:hypothetical protein
MKRTLLLLLFPVLLFLPYACQDTSGSGSNALTRQPTDYDGKIAHEWMELGAAMLRDNYLYGAHASRTYGYLGLTAWEAVCNGIPGAKSLAGQINDYPTPAYFDKSKEYDWGIVLCRAMETVFPALVDNISAAQRSQVDQLADLQESEMMGKGLSEQVRVNSVDLGNRVGLKIVERLRRDGRDVIRNIVPSMPVRDAAHPWYWDQYTLGQSPVEPLWSTIRTFVIDNAQSCEVEAPFPYSETPGSDFYQEALEVYNIERTPQNRAIAYHWENGPGRTCSPACHWINITGQLLRKHKADLGETAKAYCLAGLTASDAFSASWFMKYKYFLLRPVTYIRENIEPNWNPLVFTPPYPDYTSGSSTVGGALPVVLSQVFGDVPFIDRTQVGSALYTPDGGPFVLPERAFSSLTKAGEEQAFSRIIGGVHFRRACEMGLKAGRCVGTTVMTRLDFGF